GLRDVAGARRAGHRRRAVRAPPARAARRRRGDARGGVPGVLGPVVDDAPPPRRSGLRSDRGAGQLRARRRGPRAAGARTRSRAAAPVETGVYPITIML